MMNQKQRKAFRYVKSAIKSKNAKIEFNTNEPLVLVNFDEDLVESYDIVWNKTPTQGYFNFDNSGIEIISLIKMDDWFSDNFSLEFNHQTFALPENKVRRLYEKAQKMAQKRTNMEIAKSK